MSRNDIFRMCLQNLMRRKSRTFLTVLGVLIGCCSIVIMVSLGIGMKESQDKLPPRWATSPSSPSTPPREGGAR